MSQINGVVAGLVTNVEDRMGQGRIRVRFPWLTEQHETDWIRIATTMGGKGRGTFFMPEVDDEVLLAFDQGNVRFPYVVGFLWNGVDMPPETKSKNRVIVTPGGHSLRFEDSEGGKKVILRSNDGHEITLDDAGKAVMVQFKGGGSLKMTQNDLVLQHGHRITITRQGIALE